MKDLTFLIFLWTTYVLFLYFAVHWFLILFNRQKTINKRKKITFPEVTIVVPAYNEGSVIDNTIKKLSEVDYPKNKLYFIFINDCSKDDTLMKMRKAIKKYNLKNVRIINNRRNIGKAASLNKALKYISTDFFITLDADSYPDKTAIKELFKTYYELKHTHKRPNIVAVTSTILLDQTSTLLGKLQWVEYYLMMLTTDILSKIDAQYVTPGPLTLFSTKIVKSIGGFDPGNITEDQEIAYRLREKGYSISYCKSAKVYTYPEENFKGYYKQRNRWSKGTLINALKYKHMLLKRKYGELGFLQLPFNFLTYFFSAFLIYSFWRFFLKPLYNFFRHLYLVKFDIFTYFRDMSFSFSLLDLNFRTIFFSMMSFIIGLSLLLIAFQEYRESPKKHGIITILLFLTLYYILRGLVHVVAFLEVIFKRTHKW